MRVKLVPPPPDDVEALARAQRAVPLVPGTEADCCARIQERLGLESRDVARTWLTFLRGLGLVREGQRGFVRTRWKPTRGALANGLEDGILGVRELLGALGTEPMTADEAFEAVEARVPRWERERDHDWRSTWRTRVGYLLEWLVLAGLAERVGDGYVRA